MKEFVLLGGGGFAIELAEYMITEGRSLRGYYAPIEDKELSVVLPWLGDEKEDVNHQVEYLVAAGTMGIRKKMISFIENNELVPGTFISRRAYISRFSKIGKGLVITPGAAIVGNPTIGNYVMMNLNTIISHHCVIGNNVVLSPGVVVTGHCSLGNNINVGTNAALLPGTKLSSGVQIGMLTFPRKNVEENKLVIGSIGKTLAKDEFRR